MIGTTIGHYKIEMKLGEGGMGVVYKATDTKLNRTVALKFLPEHIASSAQDTARFTQEAQAAAGLNHPNICTIYGIEEAAGKNFIVMEFVDGKMLEEVKSTLSQKQAIEIGIQIAEGLAAAHEKGIVHRDIKPENIMLRKDGRVQVMDFGLAKLRGASRLTREGSTVGTAGYMSPEQVQGQETDHRSDIFSLGVLLYEMLAGQLPFKGVHETAMAYEIVNVDVQPMSSIKPDMPPEIDAIVLECLEKDPNERTQSAKQVAIDLKRQRRESSKSRLSRSVPTRTFERPVSVKAGEDGSALARYRRFFWPAVSSALLLVIVLLAWRPWMSKETPRPVMRFSIDLPPEAGLDFNTGLLDFSSDGKYIVFSGGTVGGNQQLYLRRTDDVNIHPLTGTSGGVYPAFSPDGQWIAYEINGVLMKISVSGGAAQRLCDLQGQSRGFWWADNSTILYGHVNRGIMRVSANGGEPELVTKLDSALDEISHRFPQLLPDGKTLLYTVKQSTISSFNDALIIAERIDSGERKVLVRGGSFGRYVPSGQLVYVRGSSVFAVPFDPASFELRGQPMTVEYGGWLNQFSGDAYLAFSNTGDLVYVPSEAVSVNNVLLSWIDRQGTVRPLLDSAQAFFTASASPDGQKLAITVQAANDGVWVHHLARKNMTRFTFGGGNSTYPIWSPDGKYIAYVSERGTANDIFRKPWDGSGPEERLTNGLNIWNLTSWSPDGRNIAFVQNGDIWILPLEENQTAAPFLNSPAGEANPRFSPDGRWLAFDSNESGRQEVYVVPFPRGNAKYMVSSGGGSNPFWDRRGKELYFTRGSSVMAVEIISTSPFDYSAQKKIFTLPPSTLLTDLAPSGQFVATILSKQAKAQTKLEVVLNWFDDLKSKVAGGK